MPSRKAPLEDKLFFKIGEVARLTKLKPYVLRYWETEFPFLKPRKTPKGQRVYKKKDVEIILMIKELLYDRGFTIAGARRVLRAELRRKEKKPSRMAERPADARLAHIKKELRAILTLLGHDA